MSNVPPFPVHLNPAPQETPPQVGVAFRALGYCRSITDPGSLGLSDEQGTPSTLRPLTSHEVGMEIAALNLLRDYLNGELDFNPQPIFMGIAEDDCDEAGPFAGPWPNAEGENGELEAAS